LLVDKYAQLLRNYLFCHGRVPAILKISSEN